MTAQTRLMTPKTIAMLVVVLVVFPLLPMLISGDWGWWQAWAYAIVSDLTFIVGRLLAARRHPDLIEERARFMEVPAGSEPAQGADAPRP